MVYRHFLGLVSALGTVGILLGAVLILSAVGMCLYNRLVSLRNAAHASWSHVEAQLQKRHHLIPNLVEILKGYATHEGDFFERVEETRTVAMQAPSHARKAHAEGMLRETLKALFAVAEAYPELKTDANFIQIQSQLKELEDRIEHEKRHYNTIVHNYNTLTESVPSSIIAYIFSFEKIELFLEHPPHTHTSHPR